MLSRRAFLIGALLSPPALAAAPGIEATAHGLKIAATTVWGEARGEREHRSRLAIAWVIRNRLDIARLHVREHGVAHPFYGPGTLEGVCQAPWQFSVWLRSDKNFRKLAAAPAHPLYPDCMKAVVAALNGSEPDPTRGSTHYTDVANPRWAKGRKPLAIIQNHRFYRL